MIEDYYGVLGIDATATEDEIKAAFRRLAVRFHPDKNPDDADAERRFKEIAAAYDVLSDPYARSAYNLSHSGGAYTGSCFATAGDTHTDAACGWGRGCCGRRGAFAHRFFSSACVVKLTPEEARRGAERTFVFRDGSGYHRVSVAIPPNAIDGAVFHVNPPDADSHSEGFDIHIAVR